MLKVMTYLILPLMFLIVYPGCTSSVSSQRWLDHIPQEFNTPDETRIVYQQVRNHFMGPSGINRAFIVMALPNETIKKIQEDGLQYFEGLESTANFQEMLKNKPVPGLSLEERESYKNYRKKVKGLFIDWEATPVKLPTADSGSELADSYPKNLWWNQQKNPPTLCKGITVCNFYGDYTSFPPSYRIYEVFKDKTLEDLNFTDEIKDELIVEVDNVLNASGGYVGYGDRGVIIVSSHMGRAYFLSAY